MFHNLQPYSPTLDSKIIIKYFKNLQSLQKLSSFYNQHPLLITHNLILNFKQVLMHLLLSDVKYQNKTLNPFQSMIYTLPNYLMTNKCFMIQLDQDQQLQYLNKQIYKSVHVLFLKESIRGMLLLCSNKLKILDILS